MTELFSHLVSVNEMNSFSCLLEQIVINKIHENLILFNIRLELLFNYDLNA